MTYSYTEKFTLVPKQMADPQYLTKIFELNSDECIASLELEQYNAVLYYAEKSPKITPIIYHMLQNLNNIEEHNKMVISYHKEQAIVHIAAAQGKKLLLANSYRAKDFTTAFYFIELVSQQVMFNPHLTQINIFGQITPQDEALLNKYYKGIRLCELLEED